MKLIVLATILSGLGFLTGRYSATAENRAMPQGGEGRIEAGFAPDGRAEQIVLTVIDSAKVRIRLSAYTYTSAPVTKALVAARKRGVDVQVVADEKSNAGSRYSQAALGALANAGIPVRLNGVYAIHHDKFVVVDGKTVETGSFNYSAAAATRNSENAVAIWNNPAVAESYETHWRSRFQEGRDFTPGY